MNPTAALPLSSPLETHRHEMPSCEGETRGLLLLSTNKANPLATASKAGSQQGWYGPSLRERRPAAREKDDGQELLR